MLTFTDNHLPRAQAVAIPQKLRKGAGELSSIIARRYKLNGSFPNTSRLAAQFFIFLKPVNFGDPVNSLNIQRSNLFYRPVGNFCH
jgi:hypothetical protein